MRIPLEFISFGFMKGRLYTHFNHNARTFASNQANKKKWGNDVVYGGIFVLRDFDFYIRQLDAYHICSLSTLRKNHLHDLHHRVNCDVTPITFSDAEEFCSLRYQEKEPLEICTYLGNPNHPKINQRLHGARPYRIVDGVDAPHFTQLIREVLK